MKNASTSKANTYKGYTLLHYVVAKKNIDYTLALFLVGIAPNTAAVIAHTDAGPLNCFQLELKRYDPNYRLIFAMLCYCPTVMR